MSIDATYLSSLKRMNSNTSMQEPSGAKNNAEKVAAMPMEAA